MLRRLAAASYHATAAAKAATPIGTAFTSLRRLPARSVAGRWGTYWEWDARLTSVLIVFPMLLGLMVLWRAAAVLTLVGAINLPITKFSVDWRITLHQSASVMRMGGSTLDRAFPIPLLVMAVAFTLLFLMLHLAAIRNEILHRRVRFLKMMQASQRAACHVARPYASFIVIAHLAAVIVVAPGRAQLS